MARERMITRTIEETTVFIMTLDIETAQVVTRSYILSGTYTADEALKRCKKLYEDDRIKLVHVESMETTEVLYGMLEEDFITHATILPPRTISK